MTTIIGYLLEEVQRLGVRHVFGVPGDYSFPINDAISECEGLKWIGNCNELNAAYAADGYARINGFACLCTTFGVGELSALGGIGGSVAEHLPVIHIVGTPVTQATEAKKVLHHSLGNGDFDIYRRMLDEFLPANAWLTPDNAVSEIDRVIAKCVEKRQPVYFCIPYNYVNLPVKQPITHPDLLPKTNQASLAECLGEIKQRLENAKKPVLLPGFLLNRFKVVGEATKFIKDNKMPFAVMRMDKGVLDETLDEFIGFYSGKMINPDLAKYVEGSDFVLNLGALWTDSSTGGFTASINEKYLVEAGLDCVKIGQATFHNIVFCDFIKALSELKITYKNKLEPRPDLSLLASIHHQKEDKINADYLFKRFEDFLKPDDILIAEMGSALFGLYQVRMKERCAFLSASLWGAIGWSLPAAFGAAVAAPDRRVILAIGDGSFQLTAQELCQFSRFNLKPNIFLLNNNGYLTERVLCKEPMIEYNDIPDWDYVKLTEAFKMKGAVTQTLTTIHELDDLMNSLNQERKLSFVEVITGVMDAPPLMRKLSEMVHAKKEK